MIHIKCDTLLLLFYILFYSTAFLLYIYIVKTHDFLMFVYYFIAVIWMAVGEVFVN